MHPKIDKRAIHHTTKKNLMVRQMGTITETEKTVYVIRVIVWNNTQAYGK
jgi:cell division protein FtsL